MSNGMLVAIPVCHKDVLLAHRNLARCLELDKSANFTALIGADQFIDEGDFNATIASASKYFAEVKTFRYHSHARDNPWPQPQNLAWQSFARHIESKLQSEFKAWFWWEADAYPIKAEWLPTIWKAYQARKRPFMGHVVEGRGHMNGVAVYPSNISNFCERALIVRANGPWDVVLTAEVGKKNKIAPANEIIGHSLKRFGGDVVKDVDPKFIADLPPTVVIFHGCCCSQESKPVPEKTTIEILATMGVTPKLPPKPTEPIAEEVKVVAPKVRMVHCLERHQIKDKGDYHRVQEAFNSWEALYKTGRLIPCHVWEYQRDARSIGDERCLPYLKDVLVEGMTKAPDDNEIVILTNDDTVLHRDVLDAIEEKIKTVSALCSFRINLDSIDGAYEKLQPCQITTFGKPDLGRDLFAFRKRWLRDHWHEIPDMILGEIEFDLVLSAMCRISASVDSTTENWARVEPACELELGHVLHKTHKRGWMDPRHKTAPARIHNHKLATGWARTFGYQHLIK